MLVETGARDENLARARTLVRARARSGATSPSSPSASIWGGRTRTPRVGPSPFPGPPARSSRRRRGSTGSGSSPASPSGRGTSTFNASILLDDRGRIRLKHHKINELDIAWDIYSRGTTLEVADTPFGRVGITICADNAPDSVDLGLALGAMGARLILSPCAWAVDADHDNTKEPYGRDVWDPAYTVLADKRGLATVGVSNVGRLEAGPWKGRHCIGSSLAMGGDGTVLARAPYGVGAETMLAVEVPVGA